MQMSQFENGPNLGSISRPAFDGSPGASRIGELSDRQRSYLRLVLQLKTSKEIAAATGTSPRAVDKQLLKANSLLGASTRFQSAQMLAAFEQGVEPLPGATALPIPAADFRLSRPWPTAEAAVNMLPWKQVAAWIMIISIAIPAGLTTAGMAYLTVLFLLGHRPY